MKYLVILGDGMADRPSAALHGRTPLQLAKKPNIDFLAQNGTVGTVKTVPDGYPCGSDTANLGVIGYDQTRYYTGRSPLEAVSMGIDMKPDDVAFRCNLVTLTEETAYEDCQMVDYSSGEITTGEAAILIAFLNEQFRAEGIMLYPGIGYRHCLIFAHARTGTVCVPPHDIMTRRVGDYLPQGEYAARLIAMMKRSRELLRDHPVNVDRVRRGLHPASSVWFWGEGTRPALPAFEQLYRIRGGVVSAVDLIKGIGICAGMKIADVPGATGNIDTNYRGKADAAMELFADGCDLVYLHIEAPDECGHRFEPENKVRAIELIDSEILGYLLPRLQAQNEAFCVMVLPDHPTPLELRTHTPDPVPFVIYRSAEPGKNPTAHYDEQSAEETGLYVEKGSDLMKIFVG